MELEGFLFFLFKKVAFIESASSTKIFYRNAIANVLLVYNEKFGYYFNFKIFYHLTHWLFAIFKISIFNEIYMQYQTIRNFISRLPTNGAMKTNVQARRS